MVVLAAAAGIVAGCATGAAFRDGQDAARSGDWDGAVEHYRRAVQEDPRNAAYRTALQRAMLSASRAHLDEARVLEADGALAEAVREYRIAGELDPGNTYAAGRALELERAVRDQLEAARPPAPIDEMQDIARRETGPPLLDPASGQPLSLRFVDQSLQDILDFIGNATGNQHRLRPAVPGSRLHGPARRRHAGAGARPDPDRQPALLQGAEPAQSDRGPGDPQKRLQYEDQIIRTFYISNADVQELSTVLNQIIRGGSQVGVQPTIVPNVTSNTIAVRSTPAVMAVIEQVIAANDKPRAEIIVDIEILEVSRERAREFGLDLTQYSVSSVYAPDAAPGSAGDGNLFAAPPLVGAGDFFFSIPSVAIDFLEDGRRDARGGQAAASRSGGRDADAEPRRRHPGADHGLHADCHRRRHGESADLVQLPSDRRHRRDDAARDVPQRDHSRPRGGEQHARPERERGGAAAADVRHAPGGLPGCGCGTANRTCSRDCCGRRIDGRCGGSPASCTCR